MYQVKIVSENKLLSAYPLSLLTKQEATDWLISEIYRLKTASILSQDEATPGGFFGGEKDDDNFKVVLRGKEGSVELSAKRWLTPKLSRKQEEGIVQSGNDFMYVSDYENIRKNILESLVAKGYLATNFNGWSSNWISTAYRLSVEGRILQRILKERKCTSE